MTIGLEELSGKLTLMSAEEAVAHLEKIQPGVLKAGYKELIIPIKNYPANLAAKKLVVSKIEGIESIEDKNARNNARRLFIQAAIDVQKNGVESAGGAYFLNENAINEALPKIARTDDDPVYAQKAAQIIEGRRTRRALFKTVVIAGGAIGAAMSGKALATGQPILPTSPSASMVSMEGDKPQRDNSPGNKILVLLASLAITGIGAYGVLGTQPTDAAEDLIQTLNPILDKRINERLGRSSGEGGLGRG